MSTFCKFVGIYNDNLLEFSGRDFSIEGKQRDGIHA